MSCDQNPSCFFLLAQVIFLTESLNLRPARHRRRGIDRDDEGRNHEPRIPTGLRLVSGETSGDSYDNCNTWPVNSEGARRLRREFVQEGFRRQYSSAGTRGGENDNLNPPFPRNNGAMESFVGTFIGAIRTTVGAIVSLGNSFAALNDAIAADLSQANISEGNRVIREDTSTGDWMYYAQ